MCTATNVKDMFSPILTTNYVCNKQASIPVTLGRLVTSKISGLRIKKTSCQHN